DNCLTIFLCQVDALIHYVYGYFQLQDNYIRIFNQLLMLLNIRFIQCQISAWYDYDFIVPRIIDRYITDSGSGSTVKKHSAVTNVFLLQFFNMLPAEFIIAQLADHTDICSEPRCCNCLICSLTTGVFFILFTDICFAFRGHLGCFKYQVCHKTSDHKNFFHECSPSLLNDAIFDKFFPKRSSWMEFTKITFGKSFFPGNRQCDRITYYQGGCGAVRRRQIQLICFLFYRGLNHKIRFTSQCRILMTCNCNYLCSNLSDGIEDIKNLLGFPAIGNCYHNIIMAYHAQIAMYSFRRMYKERRSPRARKSGSYLLTNQSRFPDSHNDYPSITFQYS